jgi:tRNA splicing endonuclease
VKGQKAEFFDIEDDNPEDDFLYVYFVYRGKEKTGYVLRSDVKFE